MRTPIAAHDTTGFRKRIRSNQVFAFNKNEIQNTTLFFPCEEVVSRRARVQSQVERSEPEGNLGGLARRTLTAGL